jgi:ABC-type oligopeptide transport system substrate-binding subunit
MSLRRWFFVFVFVALHLCQNCSKSASDSFENQIRMAVSQDPHTIEPIEADSGASLFVVKQLTSTLLTAASDGGISVQEAESFIWEKNGFKLIIKVKPNLKWSNGEVRPPCTYYEAALKNLDPKTRGPFSDLLFEVKGYNPEWTAFDFEKKRAEIALSCDEVKREIVVESRVPYSRKIISAFAFPITSPTHEDYPKVTSGPFKIYHWKKGESLLLLRNSFFSEPRVDGAAESVRIQVIKDSTVASILFDKGELDVVDEIPLIQIEKYQKNGTLKTWPFVATYMLGFGFYKKPLDVNFRKAISSIVRKIEIELLLKTGEKPAEGWVPISLAKSATDYEALSVFSGKTPFQFDTFKKGFKKTYLDIPIYFNLNERNKLILERAGRLLEENLGFKFRLEPTEWKVLLSDLKNNPPQIYRFAWTAVYPDPLFFLEIFQTGNINNYGRWSHKEYDLIVKELLEWPTFERDQKFWKKFKRAHEILVLEDPALVPIYHYVKNFLVSQRLLNWNADFRGIADLSKVQINHESKNSNL